MGCYLCDVRDIEQKAKRDKIFSRRNVMTEILRQISIELSTSIVCTLFDQLNCSFYAGCPINGPSNFPKSKELEPSSIVPSYKMTKGSTHMVIRERLVQQLQLNVEYWYGTIRLFQGVSQQTAVGRAYVCKLIRIDFERWFYTCTY